MGEREDVLPTSENQTAERFYQRYRTAKTFWRRFSFRPSTQRKRYVGKYSRRRKGRGEGKRPLGTAAKPNRERPGQNDAATRPLLFFVGFRICLFCFVRCCCVLFRFVSLGLFAFATDLYFCTLGLVLRC